MRAATTLPLVIAPPLQVRGRQVGGCAIVIRLQAHPGGQPSFATCPLHSPRRSDCCCGDNFRLSSFKMQQFRQPAIEKVEAHGNVGFEVVVLTPHEIGQDNGHLEPRARQNVLIQ
jgi:hypothetical protein